jgi:hypothetical protein
MEGNAILLASLLPDKPKRRLFVSKLVVHSSKVVGHLDVIFFFQTSERNYVANRTRFCRLFILNGNMLISLHKLCLTVRRLWMWYHACRKCSEKVFSIVFAQLPLMMVQSVHFFICSNYSLLNNFYIRHVVWHYICPTITRIWGLWRFN